MAERFMVRLDGAETPFPCNGDERVITAMERAVGLGLLRHAGQRIPVGCRRGGCGVCRVEVLEGRFASAPMSCDHVTAQDREAGIVLACSIYPLSDLSLRLMARRCHQDTSPKKS